MKMIRAIFICSLLVLPVCAFASVTQGMRKELVAKLNHFWTARKLAYFGSSEYYRSVREHILTHEESYQLGQIVENATKTMETVRSLTIEEIAVISGMAKSQLWGYEHNRRIKTNLNYDEARGVLTLSWNPFIRTDRFTKLTDEQLHAFDELTYNHLNLIKNITYDQIVDLGWLTDMQLAALKVFYD